MVSRCQIEPASYTWNFPGRGRIRLTGERCRKDSATLAVSLAPVPQPLTPPLDANGSTPLGRHQFLIYRLFSLAGLIPVGAYVIVHLLTNALVINGPESYQRAVDQIHSLGVILPLVEWVFIFIPILFHATIGIIIISGGLPNSGAYPYGSNIRYTLQRATGMIVFAFILWHVWQMHHLGSAIGGGRFDPDHATSSTAIVLSDFWVRLLYGVGMLSAVYHLSNGLWTQGITWGIWVTPGAMRRAGRVCVVFGLLLAAVGLTSIYGMSTVNMHDAEAVEQNNTIRQDFDAGKIPATWSNEK